MTFEVPSVEAGARMMLLHRPVEFVLLAARQADARPLSRTFA